MTSLKEHDENDDDGEEGTVSDSAAKSMFLASLLTAVLSIAPQTVMAVTGGGLDFAGWDISGQDFSTTIIKARTLPKSSPKEQALQNQTCKDVDFTRPT